jgi:hypothetical protein
MKKLIFILFVLAISSCKKDNLDGPNDLFAEWRWKSTGSQTAEKLDTTYYWRFQNNGILQIKDINKQIKYETNFKLDQPGWLIIKGNKIGDAHDIYSIRNDTLHLTNTDGIVSTLSIFVKASN